MTESDKNQQEIKNILASHKELDYAWLANKTGQTYDHVYYVLCTSSYLPKEDYFTYKLAFEKHGYSKNSAEYCKDILPAALIANSKVNDGLKKINEAVAEALPMVSTTQMNVIPPVLDWWILRKHLIKKSTALLQY